MSIRLMQQIALAITAAILGFAGQARPIEINGKADLTEMSDLRREPLYALPRVTASVALLPVVPAGARLRCWQHGVAVMDEWLAEAVVTPGTAQVSALGSGGQAISMIQMGSGLCLVSASRRRGARVQLIDQP